MNAAMHDEEMWKGIGGHKDSLEGPRNSYMCMSRDKKEGSSASVFGAALR